MNARSADLAEASVDDAFLAELDAAYGAEMRRALTISFMREVTRALSELRIASVTLDAAQLQHLGHRLSGAAASFRARALARIAARLEHVAAAGALTKGSVGALVDGLETEAGVVRAALVDRGALDA